jgi:hypothetical protein
MLKKIKEVIKNWLFKDEIKSLDSKYDAIDKALIQFRDSEKKLSLELPKYTVLEPYAFNDIQYLKRLHEIITDDKFLFCLYAIKSELVSKITVGGEKEAILHQGMLKGLNEVFVKLLESSRAYKDLSQAQEVEPNEQV